MLSPRTALSSSRPAPPTPDTHTLSPTHIHETLEPRQRSAELRGVQVNTHREASRTLSPTKLLKFLLQEAGFAV